MKAHLFLAVPALALVAATPLMAQTTITGIEGLDDRLEDIEDDAADDLAESQDAARFGYPEFQPGFSGSAAMSYVAQNGTTDEQDFSLGLRLRYAAGQLVQSLGAVIDISEVDDVRETEDTFVIYDANYYFNERFYVFALARAEREGLPEGITDPTRDAFIGIGPGYRIINEPDMAWRLQAGVGASYLRFADGESTTEVGYIASSRFFWQWSDSVFLTNDTDILSSDTALRANNDLGVNFQMNDTFSTRVSYLTDYNDERDSKTDNRFGVSLVVGF